MNRLIIASLLVLALPLAAGAADTEKLIADAYKACENALVVVKCTYQDESGDQEMGGIAMCYDAQKGEFVTFALSGKMQADKIKNLRLELPGAERKTIKAELLGIRPEANIGFVRATEEHQWQAIRFAEQSGVQIGQAVASVGMLPGDPAGTLYTGVGYVSTKRRIPEDVYMITGGSLTCLGSPVFREDGLAIGVVSRSQYLDYQMATQQGTVNVALSGVQSSSFFLPIEEFAYVMKRIPQGGAITRPPWLGVLKIVPVGPEQAELMKLDKPAAMIDDIVPGTPAEDAGLKGGDVIVAFNGEPLEKYATPDLTVRALMQKISKITEKTVRLTLVREGKTVDVTLPLMDMPQLPEEAPKILSAELGAALRERVWLSRFLDKSPTAEVQGLEVWGVQRSSPAADAGLAAGDIVTAINAQPVKSIAVFKQILDKSLAENPTKAVELLVRRGAQEPMAISITPAAQSTTKPAAK